MWVAYFTMMFTISSAIPIALQPKNVILPAASMIQSNSTEGHQGFSNWPSMKCSSSQSQRLWDQFVWIIKKAGSATKKTVLDAMHLQLCYHKRETGYVELGGGYSNGFAGFPTYNFFAALPQGSGSASVAFAWEFQREYGGNTYVKIGFFSTLCSNKNDWYKAANAIGVEASIGVMNNFSNIAGFSVVQDFSIDVEIPGVVKIGYPGGGNLYCWGEKGNGNFKSFSNFYWRRGPGWNWCGSYKNIPGLPFSYGLSVGVGNLYCETTPRGEKIFSFPTSECNKYWWW